MAAVELEAVAALLRAIGQYGLSSAATTIATAVRQGISTYGVINHPVAGKVYAYEVDGYDVLGFGVFSLLSVLLNLS